eukprot:TRINITY_DN1954_c1_g1_i2.p3 TRINITY_DN1954_c1_g1~~TRINITY_DN1954_c1_g1_i2.p3  ORF type:complete len:196 (+),score=1.04 TRINITY_DN1954_c1_g1_i2:570-1157(+)
MFQIKLPTFYFIQMHYKDILQMRYVKLKKRSVNGSQPVHFLFPSQFFIVCMEIFMKNRLLDIFAKFLKFLEFLVDYQGYLQICQWFLFIFFCFYFRWIFHQFQRILGLEFNLDSFNLDFLVVVQIKNRPSLSVLQYSVWQQYLSLLNRMCGLSVVQSFYSGIQYCLSTTCFVSVGYVNFFAKSMFQLYYLSLEIV